MGTDRTAGDVDGGSDRLGLTPRAIATIFDKLYQMQASSGGRASFRMKLSYIEIYNEELIDLLAGARDVKPTVQIREDKRGSIFWSGLREVTVNSVDEVMQCVSALSTSS